MTDHIVVALDSSHKLVKVKVIDHGNAVRVLTIKLKACSVAGPSSNMFRKACAVMTKTVLAARVLGQVSALMGLSELMHSTRPGMQSAALNTPAAL